MQRTSRITVIRFFAIAAVVIIVLYVTVVRSYYYQPASHARSKVGEAWLTKGFAVGVVWPKHSDLSFGEGVQLAWEEVNAGKTALAGKIRLREFEEPDETGRIAAKVASYTDVVAVLGHEFSDAAIPASVEYEQHGILFFTPNSSSPRLTEHGFNYTFRLTPDDTYITDAIVAFAKAQGYKRIGVLYQRSEGGESPANLFQAKAEEAGLEIGFIRSYLPTEPWQTHDYRPMIADFQREQFDALMLADQLPNVTKLLKDLAVMNVRQPILGTDDLDGEQLWRLAGAAANNVYVASAVDPSSQSPEFVAFAERFQKRFGVAAGYGASQGYDAFMLLADACLKSAEADPIIVATTLRTNSWHGLFGDYTFDSTGDVIGRRVSIKRMQNGVFSTVVP